ncbi:hypothetical protein BZG36_02972 [Bifiguratus adelaidae]|uniref:Uncharacterized protein n=1 Tax=Bifiguratus adelaidae TaxID=1938954 RepID=A0A261Y0W2_9FUNG|nr:hypothetical protein BZG36_02972 [Bifiguratus adelaidae]
MSKFQRRRLLEGVLGLYTPINPPATHIPTDQNVIGKSLDTQSSLFQPTPMSTSATTRSSASAQAKTASLNVYSTSSNATALASSSNLHDPVDGSVQSILVATVTIILALLVMTGSAFVYRKLSRLRKEVQQDSDEEAHFPWVEKVNMFGYTH